ncbi:MAG: YceI family protein [Phycisphaeraceae bacterium]|nr:YceI family protein [Phycisphaeraceae bacterium]
MKGIENVGVGRWSRALLVVGAVGALGGAGALLAGAGAGSGSGSARQAGGAATSAPAASGALTVDGSHSSVIYRVSHAGVVNFYGRFNKVEGTFDFDPANPSSAVFDVSIPADSIDSNNKQRDDHLKSPDFFNAKQFPTITFKGKEVRKAGEHFELVGDLTLLGQTKPITAKLEHIGAGDRGPRMGYRAGFEATFTFKRSDFGMTYGVKDGMLGDEVTVIVALQGMRR